MRFHSKQTSPWRKLSHCRGVSQCHFIGLRGRHWGSRIGRLSSSNLSRIAYTFLLPFSYRKKALIVSLKAGIHPNHVSFHQGCHTYRRKKNLCPNRELCRQDLRVPYWIHLGYRINFPTSPAGVLALHFSVLRTRSELLPMFFCSRPLSSPSWMFWPLPGSMSELCLISRKFSCS